MVHMIILYNHYLEFLPKRVRKYMFITFAFTLRFFFCHHEVFILKFYNKNKLIFILYNVE